MKNSPFSQARESVNMTCTTSIDAMFKRKRGRPPKNRVIEVGVLLGRVSQRPVLDKYFQFNQHRLCRKKG
jgi:hypothetical protein